ncbi:MAG TPA: branched-chain amino acid ABC transporter permease [Micromonospora sp.]|nr:branched-chain amino acid ABC transporter permease [Micromonospora sp.]
MRRLLGYAVFATILFTIPAIFTRVPPYTMSDGVQMAILAIAALGLVPLTGYANQISLGQAAFYGTGAYASAILTVHSGWNLWLALLVGAALAGGGAYLLGLFIFRVTGHYLALATIALGLVLAIVARQLAITGGSEGLPGIPYLSVFGFELTGDVNYYYFVAAVLLVATLVVGLVVRSSLGRSLIAVGDSAFAAAASGIDIARYKRVAFVLAAVLAAVAGSLYAHWVTYVDVHTLDLLLSIQLLIIVAVGGLRSVWGAAVGSFIIVSLVRFSKEWLPVLSQKAGGQVEIVAYGAALILVLLFLPHGVVGGFNDLAARLRPARGPVAPGSPSPAGSTAAPTADTPALSKEPS